MTSRSALVLLCTSVVESRRKLKREIRRYAPGVNVQVAPEISSCLDVARHKWPVAIVVDDLAFTQRNPRQALRELSRLVPLILIGQKMEKTFARLIAEGRADFVFRSGNFPLLVAALIDRRMRTGGELARPHRFAFPRSVNLPSQPLAVECLENLPHDVNNALTGIIGNVELVLRAKGRSSVKSARRLQTAVEIALQLRDDTRAIGNHADSQPRLASRL